MYNTDFRCTYQINADEDDEISDDLYRSQLLQAFGLERWNDEEVSLALESVITMGNEGKTLEQRARRLEVTNPMFSLLREQDKEGILFSLLFQFDLFWATHEYLCTPEAETLKQLDDLIDAKVSVCR